MGFATAGFRFCVVSELVEKRLEVARLNHPDAVAVSGDLRTTWPVVVDSFRDVHGSEAPALLSGCPPCQGMSSARGDRGKENDPDAGSRDGRNLLVLPIAEVARELRPTFVVVENVPAFLRRKVWDPDSATPCSAAKILCNRLESDYHIYAAVVDLCEFGIPQHRSRAFLTLVRKDTEALRVLTRTGRAPFPATTHGGPDSPDFVTIDDALRESGLPALDAGSFEGAGFERAIRCTEFPSGLTEDMKWWPRYRPEAARARGKRITADDAPRRALPPPKPCVRTAKAHCFDRPCETRMVRGDSSRDSEVPATGGLIRPDRLRPLRPRVGTLAATERCILGKTGSSVLPNAVCFRPFPTPSSGGTRWTNGGIPVSGR